MSNTRIEYEATADAIATCRGKRLQLQGFHLESGRNFIFEGFGTGTASATWEIPAECIPELTNSLIKQYNEYKKGWNQENLPEIAAYPIISPTNSPIGSEHWYNTLLGHIQRMGEYISEHCNQPLIREYGRQIKKDADNLYGNYGAIKDQPSTVLSLKIQYEESEFNEERIFADTSDGLLTAINAAETINEPHDAALLPDIFATSVTLWRWTNKGTYYEPKELKVWTYENNPPSIEVGKTYIMKDGETLVKIIERDNSNARFPFTGEDPTGYVYKYDENGIEKNGDGENWNLAKEYTPNTKK